MAGSDNINPIQFGNVGGVIDTAQQDFTKPAQQQTQQSQPQHLMKAPSSPAEGEGDGAGSGEAAESGLAGAIEKAAPAALEAV